MAAKGIAIAGWLVCTWKVYGVLTLDTTSGFAPTLAGGLCGFLSSLFLCYTISWIWPQPPYDWEGTRNIEVLDDADAKIRQLSHDDEEDLEKALRTLWWWGAPLTFIIVIAWPLLALPAGIFSLAYFKFWCILTFIWGVVSLGVCSLLPVWESRGMIALVMRRLSAKRSPATESNMKLPRGCWTSCDSHGCRYMATHHTASGLAYPGSPVWCDCLANSEVTLTSGSARHPVVCKLVGYWKADGPNHDYKQVTRIPELPVCWAVMSLQNRGGWTSCNPRIRRRTLRSSTGDGQPYTFNSICLKLATPYVWLACQRRYCDRCLATHHSTLG
ncbi:hypothetical protein WJX73_000887 [Symbiochloris irregularis]|uniref:Uncharacterized protein n=1 Tax=Symbiochloris irregularis TaxID=706552 RepID=A0AAW1PQ27_9CHLO